MPITSRIPLWLKVAYTSFVAVLVVVYWRHYGPTNFLYFCDVALLITAVGIWLESPLLISTAAVGIFGSQTLWVVDFLLQFVGFKLSGMTDYMFDSQQPLYLRGLSLFHGWLPFLLVYLVWRLGYDRRGLIVWTVIAWGLILICYFVMPPPSPNHGLQPVNINYVYGFGEDKPQTWMPAAIWLSLEMILLPLVLYFPVHLLLRRYCSVGTDLRVN